MITTWWVEGTMDGHPVAGFQIAPTRKEAMRLARHFAGVKRGRGRPKKGVPSLQITVCEKAG